MASNYAFHMALNFRLCTLKMLQLLEDSDPPDCLLGLRPRTPLGYFRPIDPLIWPPKLHLLDPPLMVGPSLKSSCCVVCIIP